MVFVEFTSPNRLNPGKKLYFVGASLDDVLNDTNGGNQFGDEMLLSFREITEGEARVLKLSFLEQGITAIKALECKSYKIGPALHRKSIRFDS